MGSTRSNLRRPADTSLIEKVASSTHFTKQEVCELYKAFLTTAPSGKLTESEFAQAYSMFFPIADDAAPFASHIFRTFDERSLGRMEFSDYANAMSVMQRGTVDEKVDWLFRVFDVDGDGQIQPEEMREIFEALDHLVTNTKERSRRASRASPSTSPTPGPYSSWISSHRSDGYPPDDKERLRQEAISARTKAVFADMDLNGDGRIDRQEFSEMIKEDEHVQEFLKWR